MPTLSSNVLLAPLGDRTTLTETRHSAEELQHIVEEAAKAGTVHLPDAGEIASRAIDFADLRAGDVMVPREQVVLSRHAAAEEAPPAAGTRSTRASRCSTAGSTTWSATSTSRICRRWAGAAS
ncbi:MAG: hypothetical protein U0802_25970 [Candidatus Binatia bacterium]